MFLFWREKAIFVRKKYFGGKKMFFAEKIWREKNFGGKSFGGKKYFGGEKMFFCGKIFYGKINLEGFH
jgi:hypothetical protein